MGNNQSAEAPHRRSNKLSKPKTNTSTANLLSLKASGPPNHRNSRQNHGVAANGRYSTVSVHTAVSEETKQQKRRTVFRSKSAQPETKALHVNSGVDIDFLEPSPLDRWSTRGLITNQLRGDQQYFDTAAERPPARGAQSSIQQVQYAQPNPRLSFVDETPSPRLQKMRSLERRSQYIQEDERQQQAKPVPARTNSETDLYAPIRRRSFLQHGIATRKSWVEDDPRQSFQTQKHAPDELQNYNRNPAKPPVDGLSGLAALGPKFEDDEPGPRTVTPNDSAYSHIGAYKLGSLRITNGAASPASSIGGRAATMGAEEDYFMSSDGRGSASSHFTHRSKRSNTISVTAETIRSPWITRAESPLRQSHTELKFEPLTINTSLPLPEISLFNFSLTDSPTKSLELAHEYMQDLALSPFSFDNSPPASPKLETTSKHMAIDDNLFEPDPATPALSDVHAARSFDSGYDIEVVDTAEPAKKGEKGPKDRNPKPLAKADSGYSSNVSIRSFKASSAPAVPAEDVPPITYKEPVSRVASSTYSTTSSRSTSSEMITLSPNGSLPNQRTVEQLPTHPFRQGPFNPLKYSPIHKSGEQIPTPPVPSILHERALAAAPSRPQSMMIPKPSIQHTLPKSPEWANEDYEPPHNPSDISVSSKSSSTSRGRENKKQSPQSVVLPISGFTAQASRSLSNDLSIPPIQARVSRNREERVHGFSDAPFPSSNTETSHLPKKFSKDTLGRTAEQRKEPTLARLQSALPPLPPHISTPVNPSPKTEFNRRYTYQPLSPTPAASAQARKRQSIEAMSRNENPVIQQQKQMKEHFESGIASYEDLSSSRGKYPCDVAIDSTVKQRNAQETAISMTSKLEAEAATRFARARTVSQESQFQNFDSTVLHRRTSYDSIANQNPFAAVGNSRRSSRGPPPQAHAKWTGRPTSMLLTQRSNPDLATPQIEDRPRNFSMLGRERVKSPPPVSMQIKHKIVHKHIGSPVGVPPSRAPPLPPTQQRSTQPQGHFRTPPGPPAYTSPTPRTVAQDPRAEQENFWDRRQSAATVLQTRKSMDMRRPESFRPSLEQRRQAGLRTHCSWDTSQQSWRGYGPSYEDWDLNQPSYDPAYDNYSQNKENRNHPSYRRPSPEPVYYNGSSSGREYFGDERTLQSQYSTSEMLIIDRYAGGYGYEPGLGLEDSTGTRNMGKFAGGRGKSVEVSSPNELEFLDIPVMLRGVTVRG